MPSYQSPYQSPYQSYNESVDKLTKQRKDTKMYIYKCKNCEKVITKPFGLAQLKWWMMEHPQSCLIGTNMQCKYIRLETFLKPGLDSKTRRIRFYFSVPCSNKKVSTYQNFDLTNVAKAPVVVDFNYVCKICKKQHSFTALYILPFGLKKESIRVTSRS